MRLLLKLSSEARVSPWLPVAELLCSDPAKLQWGQLCLQADTGRGYMSFLRIHPPSQLAMPSSNRTTRRVSLVLLASSAEGCTVRAKPSSLANGMRYSECREQSL